MKQSPCKVAPSEASTQPEMRPPVLQGSKQERGGIGRETLTRSGLSVEGRPRGGGDPRVACRGQAGVLDDGSKMMCGKWKWNMEAADKHDVALWWQQDDLWKSESEVWRLQIKFSHDPWPCHSIPLNWSESLLNTVNLLKFIYVSFSFCCASMYLLPPLWLVGFSLPGP